MLERAGVEALAGSLKRLAVDVGSLDFDPRITFDVTVEVGEAQTALLADLLALVRGNPGIYQGHGQIFGLLGGDVDDADAC